MTEIVICNYVRTPIGRYAGALTTMHIGVVQGIAVPIERV
jgi:acetyl-CoA acetyltransferase